MTKAGKIPRFLYEIHGKNPTPLDLWLTYSAGIMAGIAGAAFALASDIDPWKVLVVGLLFFDVAGGVVANFTESTSSYYESSRRRRSLFLSLHLLQPLLMAFALGNYFPIMTFTAAFAVTGGFIIDSLETKGRLAVAAFLTVLGVLLLAVVFMPFVPIFISTFAVLFLIKILLAFSVTVEEQ